MGDSSEEREMMLSIALIIAEEERSTAELEAALGFKIVMIAGDGNCQFGAVAALVNQFLETRGVSAEKAVDAALIRELVVKEMKQNPHLYENGIDYDLTKGQVSELDYDAYLIWAARDGSWGCAITLAASRVVFVALAMGPASPPPRQPLPASFASSASAGAARRSA